MISWTQIHEQWLRAEFPSHSFDFTKVHSYAATHGGTLFEFGGTCPVHKRTHKSNHWTMWVKEMDDGRFSYKVGCFDENSPSSKRSLGGSTSASKAKTFVFKGYNEKAYYHCLEDENFYFFDLDGVFTRVEDQVCLTHLQDKESHSLSIIEFQGFYPHVLTIKPFTRFTKDGYYIRWEGDLSTVK